MLMNATNKTFSKAGTSRRKMLVIGATVAAVLLVSAGSWAMWRSYSKQKVLASIADDPRKIREAVDQGQISREEGRDAMMQAMEARMNQTMDAYFALPVGKEREKYLDQMIDEMQNRRREWQQRATTQPATRPSRPDRDERPTTQPSNRRQQFAARQDSTPPEQRARRAEFRAAMAARMAARGIEPGRGGGFGGGWGRGGGGGGGGGRGGGGNR